MILSLNTIWKESGITLQMGVKGSFRPRSATQNNIWMKTVMNTSWINSTNLKTKKLDTVQLWMYFWMCRERRLKVIRAPDLEEKGHCTGVETLPWATPYDVWLTGNTLSSPEPLTSLFTSLCRSSSPSSYSLFQFFRERGNLRRARSRVEWLQAATCSKGGHGETKAIQVNHSEQAWDRQAPRADNTEANVLAFAQSTPPDPTTVSDQGGWGVWVVSISERKGKTDWQVSKHNALKAPRNIPEMTTPVLKIFHRKVVILFMEANLGQIQNLQTNIRGLEKLSPHSLTPNCICRPVYSLRAINMLCVWLVTLQQSAADGMLMSD